VLLVFAAQRYTSPQTASTKGFLGLSQNAKQVATKIGDEEVPSSDDVDKPLEEDMRKVAKGGRGVPGSFHGRKNGGRGRCKCNRTMGKRADQGKKINERGLGMPDDDEALNDDEEPLDEEVPKFQGKKIARRGGHRRGGRRANRTKANRTKTRNPVSTSDDDEDLNDDEEPLDEDVPKFQGKKSARRGGHRQFQGKKSGRRGGHRRGGRSRCICDRTEGDDDEPLSDSIKQRPAGVEIV